MRAGLGWSTLHDEELALKEALGQALAQSGEPCFVFLFTTPEYHAGRILETLKRALPAAKVLGCASEGVIAGEKWLRKGLAVLALGGDDVEARTFVSTKAFTDPYALGEDLARDIRGEGFTEGTLVILVDPTIEVPLFLQGMYNVLGPGFLYLGGGTRTQWTEKGVSQGPASVAVFRKIEVASGVDHGWIPTQELLVVTETRGKEVVEIDGVSPFEAYRERVGDFAREDLPSVGALYPLGFPSMCGGFLIRDPVYLTPDGAMGFVGARVPRGAVGYIMKGEKENLLAAAEEVARAAISSIGEPSFALLFDCVSRPLRLENDFPRELALIREKLGRVPVCGFLSSGEIHPYGRAPVFWNKSVVVAVGARSGQKSINHATFCGGLLEAELAILHEISALDFPGSCEGFFQELVERAVRLFAVQRMGLRWERSGQPELVASWGFASLEDFTEALQARGPNQHVFHLEEKGVLLLEAPRELSNRERRLYTLFARKVEDILREVRQTRAQEQRMQELEHLSLTDELTDLYNRRGFFALAEHQFLVAQREGKNVGALLFDFDGLKRINDSFGHEAGDLALSEFGHILQKVFRKSDILARMGGDEFAAFLVDIDEAEVQKIVHRLRKLVHTWNVNSHSPYRLDFSAGWAVSHPSKIREVRELLNLADERMYEEKREKKGKGKEGP